MIKEAERQKPSVIFEGMTSISAVIKGQKRAVKHIYYDCSKEKSKAKELGFLRRKSVELGFEITACDSDFIDSLSTGNTHGGIIAECTEFTVPSIDASEIIDNGFYVMIEGIEDPYNFGYAIRSIYAAGADGIILTERNWMSAAGVVCRASAGASEMIPLYNAPAIDAIDTMRTKGYKIACAGIRDSVSAFEADLKMPVFLIVGGEKRGISSQILSKSDMIVRLDYGREFSGSLSAASAASILSYEVLRQNLNK